jgi:hypothetical protein
MKMLIQSFNDSLFGTQWLSKHSDSPGKQNVLEEAQKQIQYLQAKHGNDRSLAREFPDLKIEQRTARHARTACGAVLLVGFYRRA